KASPTTENDAPGPAAARKKRRRWSGGLVGDQAGPRVVGVAHLLLDHLRDLVVDLLLLARWQRLELILGETELCQHLGVQPLRRRHLGPLLELLGRGLRRARVQGRRTGG